MDEKKRMLVTDDCSSEQMKRIRPGQIALFYKFWNQLHNFSDTFTINILTEDIIGILKDDPSRVATRIVLNKYQFSKVIGKAGTIYNILCSFFIVLTLNDFRSNDC